MKKYIINIIKNDKVLATVADFATIEEGTQIAISLLNNFPDAEIRTRIVPEKKVIQWFPELNDSSLARIEGVKKNFHKTIMKHKLTVYKNDKLV
ncbi:MAG: hypothetical protein QXL01_00435 [Thermoplasmatales archaeon]